MIYQLAAFLIAVSLDNLLDDLFQRGVFTSEDLKESNSKPASLSGFQHLPCYNLVSLTDESIFFMYQCKQSSIMESHFFHQENLGINKDR